MNLYKGFVPFIVLAVLGGCGGDGDAKSDAPSGSPTTVAVATPVASTAPPPAAFAVCSSCHAVQPGRTGVGPNLAGVWGRKAGSLEGYPYSAPLKASGIVWDRASLDTWLQGPMKMVPGTKMVIAMTDPVGRKAVIDYLETLH